MRRGARRDFRTRAPLGGVLLLLVGAVVVAALVVPSVARAGDGGRAGRLDSRVHVSDAEILTLRVRWDRGCYGPLPRLDAERCRELERELAELEATALPPELLEDLPSGPPGLVEQVARLALITDRREAIPALRWAAETLDEGWALTSVQQTLCALGDETYFEASYGAEWRTLIERFLAAPDFDVWLRLAAICGDRELARRVRRGARVIVDVAVGPLYRLAYRGDLQLRAGEEVKVLVDGNPHLSTAGEVLISTRGEAAWLDARLLVEGEPPAVEELRRRVADAWRAGEQVDMLRPLQILVHLHDAGVGGLPLDPQVAAFLARLPRVEKRGVDTSQTRREIVELAVEQLVGGATPEVRAEVRLGHSEGWDERLEIYHGLADPDGPHGFAVWTVADTSVDSFHRFPHLVDLDADPDREIVVLEGTLSWPTPEDNARSWKLVFYDYDGRRFVPVPWTPRLEEFLRRRLEETDDPLERTILRSHFGPEVP